MWAAVDGTSGMGDPAFEAHVGPVKYWALAFWEGWFPQEDLTRAIENARAKLNVKGRSVWGRVTGPATALIATTMRLKWSWLDARTLRDDLGKTLVLGLDSPKDFASAVQDSVRRWRMERIAAIFPQLIPAHLDVHAPANTPAINIDMFGVLSPMVKGKAPTT